MIEEYIQTFFWGLTGAITLAVVLPLLIWVFDKFSPIDEWEELKKGNKAVGMVLSSLIIAFAIVMAFSILPTS